ncbi:hypothetical protein ACETK8_15650 [Brevundimonas staleyi]|uniref:DUF4892 domain-containing protein n=1 Tax=Brevundimonas staleyi TaxID=74326 RepID=A0ABW0FXJ0_9CAUL
MRAARLPKLAIVVAALAVAQLGFAQPDEPASLVQLADDLCFYPDGDHAVTWDNAARRGFTPILTEHIPGLRLPGVRQLRGFTKTIDGTEVRVLTAVNRWRAMGRGFASFHLCWVSALPANRESVDSRLGEFLKLEHFPQDDASVFAWLPQADGSRQPVSRRAFGRRYFQLSRDQGMRTVMTNHTGDRVSITYMRPVGSCEDWCY